MAEMRFVVSYRTNHGSKGRDLQVVVDGARNVREGMQLAKAKAVSEYHVEKSSIYGVALRGD